MKEKAFNNWKHNAVHLTFPNGNAISTTWGWGSYSELGDHLSKEAFSKQHYAGAREFGQSKTVEIMILNAPDAVLKKIDKKYNFGGDTVKGHVSILEWLDIVNMLAKVKRAVAR